MKNSTHKIVAFGDSLNFPKKNPNIDIWVPKCVFPKCTFSGPQLSRRMDVTIICHLHNNWNVKYTQLISINDMSHWQERFLHPLWSISWTICPTWMSDTLQRAVPFIYPELISNIKSQIFRFFSHIINYNFF